MHAPKRFRTRLDAFFNIRASGSTVRREIGGGLTTFATMSYIVFVQPTVLSTTGMDFGSVLIATCLASAIACVMMGLLARYPFALAPGMGENFLFAFVLCSTFAGGMGFSWQAGLMIVLIAAVLFMLLSVFRTREKILQIIPDCLKNAIGPAIGLFIAFVGLQWGGIVVSSPATMVKLGSFHTAPALLTVFGVFLIAVMTARRIPGDILIAILATGLLGALTKTIPIPQESYRVSFSTFFQLDASELIEKWDKALVAIALFFFLALFDSIGTFVGLGKQAGFIKQDEQLPRAGQAFFADATASFFGALFGTSTLTTYIESATGIAAGARTGLAALVTGACFLIAIPFAPLIHIAGQDIGPAFYGVSAASPHVAMYPAVAPALIFVGFMMMAPLRRVQWEDVTESLPAFLTIALMVFGYGITEGIACGCIAVAVLKPAAGRAREIHPAFYFVALTLIVRYAFLM
ncbi:MAG TPA: NCS2 family permease [Candidatus Hydrogenedentes bacterium]|nr:NCS2 family permease [Candidatus Hydrogenedentota bacterium]